VGSAQEPSEDGGWDGVRAEHPDVSAARDRPVDALALPWGKGFHRRLPLRARGPRSRRSVWEGACVRPIMGATGPGITAKTGAFACRNPRSASPGWITASRPRKQASATTSRPTRSLHSRLQRWKFLGRASERAEGRTRTPRNVDPRQPSQTTPSLPSVPTPRRTAGDLRWGRFPDFRPSRSSRASYLRPLPTWGFQAVDCAAFVPDTVAGAVPAFHRTSLTTAKQGAYRTHLGFLSRGGGLLRPRFFRLPATDPLGVGQFCSRGAYASLDHRR